ncbi:MAG: hypothetical protein KF901_12430 [Myxococcales bacterium]|nr:hypothetical protein [Myxococcales bacterium]
MTRPPKSRRASRERATRDAATRDPRDADRAEPQRGGRSDVRRDDEEARLASGEPVGDGAASSEVTTPSPSTSGGLDAPTDANADAESARALRHLAQVALALSLVAALTYVIPWLHRFRPWTPGDPIPLSSLFEPADEAYAFGGTAGAARPRATVEPDDDDGDEVVAPVIDETPEGPRLRISPSEYEDAPVAIEDPTGRGMAPFYAQLARTARREPGAVTRISHWGDSSIATDHITATMRRRLQRRFGDAGHGFILVAKGYLPYRHRDVTHRASEAWQLREITRNHDSSGWYGFGGIQYRARPGATAHFGTAERGSVGGSVSRFSIYFQRHERGGDMAWRLDDGEWVVFSTRGATPEDDVLHVTAEDGPHTLDLRFAGGGQPRLYGVALEREGPGVVYDSLGLVGARAARLLNFDAEHVARQIAMRGTHLVVLGFGGNEAPDNLTRERYEAEYREVIARMRGGRDDLGCLVFSPLDQGERDSRGRIVTMPNIPLIVEAQRAAAEAEGCAFFDTFAAMGGDGAIGRWLRLRLASGDLRHMTPSGYERVADAFHRALLQGFAAWLEANPDEARLAPDAPEVEAPDAEIEEPVAAEPTEDAAEEAADDAAEHGVDDAAEPASEEPAPEPARTRRRPRARRPR